MGRRDFADLYRNLPNTARVSYDTRSATAPIDPSKATFGTPTSYLVKEADYVYHQAAQAGMRPSVENLPLAGVDSARSEIARNGVLNTEHGFSRLTSTTEWGGSKTNSFLFNEIPLLLSRKLVVTHLDTSEGDSESPCFLR